MAILPIPLARVSDQLRANSALSAVNKTQQQLLEVQNEIATGQRVNSPSDDPGAAATIQQLQKTLEQRQAYSGNLRQANSQLSEVDSTLGDLTDLLQQAQNIASQNVGSDASADQRKAAAAVVKSISDQVYSIANKQFNGVYLFGGDNATTAPFATDASGAIKFVGSTQLLKNTVDDGTNLAFQVDGNSVFGALTTQVTGTANLAPAVAATTRLDDLSGATGDGVRKGAIQISDGATSATIDLSNADTIQDVVNDINAAGLAGVTASLTTAGIQLTGSGNISVNEVGSGTAAGDLGILKPTGAGAAVPVIGASLGAQVTPLTKVADLRNGAGLDLSGLTITNGGNTTTVSLAGATTVEDVLNKINGSKAGVLARINAAGTGIDIVNPTQGTAMTVAENGGTTAAELGVQSFTANTKLVDLNGGKGMRTVSGPDLQVTRKNGTTFSVDLDGLTTVQDVINKINAADGGGGVTASFSATSNGITLTDTTGGGGTLAVQPLNASSAAADLGLLKNAAVGSTLTGADANPISSAGIFGSLQKLQAALQTNDTDGITDSAQGLAADQQQVIVVRGTTGARVKDIQDRQNRLDTENVATKSLLSDLQDTDFTSAITKFQTLQTALQANYQTTAKMLHMSLLDFLG